MSKTLMADNEDNVLNIFIDRIAEEVKMRTIKMQLQMTRSTAVLE